MTVKEDIIRVLQEAKKPLSDDEINERRPGDAGKNAMWNDRKSLENDGVIESVGSNPMRWKLTDDDTTVTVPDDGEDKPVKSKPSIQLERNLEKYMFENLSNLEAGLTTIDKGDSQQRKVDSGILDILAKDENGNPVVIELKAGEAKHDALGQTMSYMANIADEFTDRNVRGIIVAESFSKQLTSGASIQPNVELYRYNVQFTFDRADE